MLASGSGGGAVSVRVRANGRLYGGSCMHACIELRPALEHLSRMETQLNQYSSDGETVMKYGSAFCSTRFETFTSGRDGREAKVQVEFQAEN
jgi:hypothetical protein